MDKITLQNALPQVFSGRTTSIPMYGTRMWSSKKDIFTSSKQGRVQGNPRFAAISMAIATITKASLVSMEPISVN